MNVVARLEEVHAQLQEVLKQGQPGPEHHDLIRQVLAGRELVRRHCSRHPGLFLQHVRMPDERAGTEFRFHFAPEQLTAWEAGEIRPVTGDNKGLWLGKQHLTPDYYKLQGLTGWEWQGDLLDFWALNNSTINLKARQIGLTWLRAGKALWKALYRPPANCLIYRQKEEDAGKIVERVWDMLQSLPRWMWQDAEVITPARGARPYILIELGFAKQKKRSVIRGMSSAAAAGHGETASDAIGDEFAHVQPPTLAAQIIKAAGPAVGRTGEFELISTANGRSDEDGGGNYFHYLWTNSEEMGLGRAFFSWRYHPDRDEEWYRNDPEVRRLRDWEKAEQYPDNEHDAFKLSNKIYFDQEALYHYAELKLKEPLYRCRFLKAGPRKTLLKVDDQGPVRVYLEPQPDHDYAIGADVATGRGKDYSCAYVIDLSNMTLCAEYHARSDADIYAYYLHYLGKKYNTALIAVEMGGGYGEAPVVFLRDGREGRPPYRRLYRHAPSDRPDIAQQATYGFPMTQRTRPLVLEGLERAIRERSLPYVMRELLFELESFVHHDAGTSPRAQEGLNDDRVMACAITLEMYRKYGHHPNRRRPRPRKPKRAVFGSHRLEGDEAHV